MAQQGGKGNRKKHSALQKQHYASHPHRILPNKIARIKSHLRRQARKVRQGRIEWDKQAIKRLSVLSTPKKADSFVETLMKGES